MSEHRERSELGQPGEAGPEEVAGWFRDFARETASRAPLYSSLSTSVASRADLVALLETAPPTQRRPVLFFAAVHDLLLAGPPDEPLRAFYPNLVDVPRPARDAFEPFAAFALDHAGELRVLMAERTTQTNEVGRCTSLLPVLGLLEAECGPLAHVDVGCSAGLNLSTDRYAYEYRPGGSVGDSAVVLECSTRGPVPVPADPPEIAARAGLDRSPIDVGDPAAVRWLEACVWPDQPDRFERLRAAVAIARVDPADIHRGDAVRDLARVVGTVAGRGHVVVTNSWVLTYLTDRERRAYVAALDDLGASMDLSWVFGESPTLVPELPHPPAPGADPNLTTWVLVRWRNRRRAAERLGVSHPHGYWLHWGA